MNITEIFPGAFWLNCFVFACPNHTEVLYVLFYSPKHNESIVVHVLLLEHSTLRVVPTQMNTSTKFKECYTLDNFTTSPT